VPSPQGTAQGTGPNAGAAIDAATAAAISAARDWALGQKDDEFWQVKIDDWHTQYFNLILDLEKPTEKDNKAKREWKVMGSTSSKQNKKMPKGKTALIGPAAPAGGNPPNDPCAVVFVKEGDLPKTGHQTRFGFVADALDAATGVIEQYQCDGDKCGDLRADLHLKIKFVGYSDAGVPDLRCTVHWALRMFCYEDERK
jgi:hypothetical protein